MEKCSVIYEIKEWLRQAIMPLVVITTTRPFDYDRLKLTIAVEKNGETFNKTLSIELPAS